MKPELLLKPLVSWFAHHQSVALRCGIKLSTSDQKMAEQIGCLDPKRIRVVYCNEMPEVKSKVLRDAFSRYDFSLGDASGLCLGHGIFIHKSQKGDNRILAHEMTHTMQFEQCGGTTRFLSEYISQFLKFGYHKMPFEVEARLNEKKHRFCKPG